MLLTTPTRNPEIKPATRGLGGKTEQAIRALIRARLPRLLHNRAQAFLVEEMEVCSGRARIDLAVIGDRLLNKLKTGKVIVLL